MNNTEIERKFLVTSDKYKSLYTKKYKIWQTYIHIDDNKTIRIRIIDKEKAFLTIKYNIESNVRRKEFEYEIPVEDAIDICVHSNNSTHITKNRYEVPYKNHLWYVDEYLGSIQNLVTAEIELKKIDQKIKIPKWIGKEITGNVNFSSANLSINKGNII